MRFNFLNIIWLAIFITTASCSDFLNGNSKKDQSIDLSAEQVSCIKDISPFFVKYANNEASSQDIQTQISCLQSSLSLIRRKIVTATPDGYRSEDLQWIFETFWLKRPGVQISFTNILLQMKRFLLGGSSDVLTRVEIVQIEKLLSAIGTEMIRLKPYIQILSLNADGKKITSREVQFAVLELNRSVNTLMEFLDMRNPDFGVEQIKELIVGIVQMNGKSTEEFQLRSQRWTEWFQLIKNIIYGEETNFATRKDWGLGVRNATDLYRIALEFQYSFDANKWSEQPQVKLLVRLLIDSMDLLIDSHQISKTKEIPFKQIDDVLQHLFEKERVNFAFKFETIKILYRRIVFKVLDPTRNGDTRGGYAINKTHLYNLKNEILLFQIIQNEIADQLDEKQKKDQLEIPGLLNGTYVPSISSSERFDDALKRKISKFDSFLAPRIVDPDARLNLMRDFVNWIEELNYSNLPVLFHSNNGLLISKNAKSEKQTWQQMTLANLIHSLSRGLMLGYGKDTDGVSNANVAEAKISQKKFKEWFKDFYEMGKELKMFDPRAGNTSLRSFREANYFTFSGNGDDKINFRECYEFIAFLISAGFGSLPQFEKLLDESLCRVENEKDEFFKKPIVIRECFKREVEKKLSGMFANLIETSQFFKDLVFEKGRPEYSAQEITAKRNPISYDPVGRRSDRKWDQFYSDWMDAAHQVYSAQREVKGKMVDVLELADIRTGVMLITYIDSLFVIYDTNHDGYLSPEEIHSAVPRFKKLIDTMRPKLPSLAQNADAEVLFTELLQCGGICKWWEADIPAIVGIPHIPFLVVKRPWVPVDRAQVIKIFKTLKTTLSDSEDISESTK